MDVWNKSLDAALCREVMGGIPLLWQAAQRALESGMTVPGVPEEAGALAQRLLEQHSQEEGPRLANLMNKIATVMPDAAPLFPLGLLGSMLPDALTYMQSLGAGDEICCATFSDIMRWVERYTRLHGTPGVDEYNWITLPYAGRIFEIGGLQYQAFRNPWPVFVWEDRPGGLILAADKGVQVSADGFIAGTNGLHRDVAWTTSYRQAGDWCTAHRYAPATGALCARAETFSLDGCALLAAPGAPALNLHIPAGAPLVSEAVNCSFAQAHAFFAHLQYPSGAVLCESWLLDPQLAQWLGPASAIRAFAGRFARFQVYSAGSWAHRFLFGCDRPPEELTDADVHTSLQKAVLAHWRAGGQLYDTGGVTILNH